MPIVLLTFNVYCLFTLERRESMIELSNNKTITTAKLLARAIEKHINTNITLTLALNLG